MLRNLYNCYNLPKKGTLIIDVIEVLKEYGLYKEAKRDCEKLEKRLYDLKGHLEIYCNDYNYCEKIKN